MNVDAYRANKLLLSILSNTAYANALHDAGRTEEAVQKIEGVLDKFNQLESKSTYGTQEAREHFLQKTNEIQSSTWVPAPLCQDRCRLN